MRVVGRGSYAAERILRYSYDYAEMYEMELGQDDMSLLSQEFTQINRNT